MSWLSRMANVFRGDGVSREIDESWSRTSRRRSKQGRDQSRRGAPLARRCAIAKQAATCGWWHGWSPCVRRGVGWRQLVKKSDFSAAILSLALAIGACTSAFRRSTPSCCGRCRWQTGAAVRNVSRGCGCRRSGSQGLRLGVPVVPPDARRRQGEPSCWLSPKHNAGPDLPVRSGNGESLPAVLFRLDV